MFNFIKRTRLSVILLAVVVLLIFLHYLGVIKPIEGLVIKILSPVQQRVYSLGVSINNFYSNLTIKKDLNEANKKLAEELNRLTVENAQLKVQLQENKEFSKEQEFLEAKGFKGVVAHIIGKNSEPAQQIIILDKGEKAGIKIGFPVITAEGVIVGKIYQVKNYSSEAILIYDSYSRMAALIQNESQSKGIVMGEHGLSLKMELIPKNELIKENDIVVTSGLEQNIPQGLVIGKISRFLNEPNDFFQTAWLQSPIKVDNLIFVSVLISPAYD